MGGVTPPPAEGPPVSLEPKGAGEGGNGIPFKGAHREMPGGFQKAILGRGMNSSCPPSKA